jgi:hypothetical protein
MNNLSYSAPSLTLDIPKQRRAEEALLCDMDLPLRGIFYPLGYSLEILTNEPAVLEAADESFGHMRARQPGIIFRVRVGVSEGGDSECPPEPVRREFKHLFSLVADAHNQALLDLESYANFIWVKKATVNRRLYFRYNLLEKPVYVLLGSSVVTDLHAACVSKNGKGILLCGDSGAGKTTLSYACARAGWTYTSDDTSYLVNCSEESTGPRVYGHSHRVRFRPTAKALFPELGGRELALRLEGKPSIEVATSELPGISTASEAMVHSIVYLKRSPSGSGRLVLLPDGTAIGRMGEQLYSCGDIRAKQQKALQVLGAIPAYELHYRDLDHAIHQLEGLTRGA